MKKLFILLITIFLISCGTEKKVSIISYSTPLDKSVKVEVLGIGQKAPDGAKYIGIVKIGDSGFTTKCSYAEVISDAQEQARGMGGNLLIITKHKEPGILTTCHKITADVYLVK